MLKIDPVLNSDIILKTSLLKASLTSYV